jgi:hypothetical protein
LKEAVQGVIEGKFSIRIVAESNLIRKEFINLAFDLAESLRILHKFHREKRKAGKDFLLQF